MATFLALTLAGCGGGGSTASPSPAAAGIVSGSVVKGPVASASVTAYAIEAGVMGRLLGTGTTDAQGNFSMATGDYGGAMMLRATGGHFMDEASGTDSAMQAADAMTAALPRGAMTTGVQITPLTSFAQTMASRMAAGMSDDNIAAANAGVGRYFMVSDIVHVHPMDPLATASAAGAGADARNYGMSLAAMSQLAASLGMPHASGMVTAMAQDAADGCFDGNTAGTPVMMGGGMMGGSLLPSYAGTSGMSNAMARFVRSPMNRSGATVQDLQALINQLMASSCSLR